MIPIADYNTQLPISKGSRFTALFAADARQCIGQEQSSMLTSTLKYVDMHLFSGPEPVKERLKFPLLSWLTSIGRLCSCRAASMLIAIFPSLTSRYGFLTQSGMQALKQERTRRTCEGAPASILAETEDALVGFFIEGCRFEMQAGHMERAVASIQAALENTCFAPSIPVGMLSCAVQLMLCTHL